MKRKILIAALFAAVLTLPAMLTAQASSYTEKTSAIRAHHYTIDDVTTVQRIVAEAEAASEDAQDIYDLDFNGSITIADATIIQRYCAELIDIKSDTYLLPFQPEEPTTEQPTTIAPTTEQPTTIAPTTEAIYLRLDFSSLKMGVNERFTFTPETNADHLSYVSTDDTILTVDDNGTVTPQGVGKASVVCDAGSGVTAWCDFEICPAATRLTLNSGSTLDIGVGEVFDFDSYVDAGTAACWRYYSSSNENVIKVERFGGVATAVGTGKATVRCVLENGVSAACEVTVYRMAQALELNTDKLTLALGDQFDFDSHVKGGGYAYFRSYYSLDESVVSIARNGGLATAVGIGSTRVYCELVNGVRAYADVTVVEVPHELRLINAPSLMQVGERVRFRVAADTAVNNATLTVTSQNGLVRKTDAGLNDIELTGIRRGSDVVTVRSADGLEVSFQVTVDGSAAACIDVSVWQGDIDFNKVRQSGVDYVIIRAGYGRELYQMDNQFISNYDKAKAAGLKVGVYWFSYAEKVEEAFAEANACLYCLGGRQLDLPVYYDLEIDEVMNRMTQEEYTQMAMNFCSAVRDAGYRPGVYSSVSVYQSKLNKELLEKEGISIWNAHWAPRCTIDCDIWQYSESGSVIGINGDVDMNWIYNLDVAE